MNVVSDIHFSPRPNRAAEIRWRPWGDDAFAEARILDRPVLLSISAVWCHWCHVMDETTYSSAEVIALINERWVPIRVDNDVRPDINQRYNMGGWPTTAFLTAEGEILTGATYIPPDQMLEALRRLERVYSTQRPAIAARILEARSRSGAAGAGSRRPLERDAVTGVLDAAAAAFDAVNGGFGTAPKFPHPELLCLLAEQATLRGEPNLGEMAVHSLSAMAGGGTYDHVEGGFFRYSTTADWSVPHFEKMLEDHGGLLQALAICGLDGILDGAVAYLDRVLLHPATGLYGGSQDADEAYYSAGAEGRAAMAAPQVDHRAYSAWNCALAVAQLEADRRLGRPLLRDRASRLLETLFAERLVDGDLEHLPGLGGLLGDQVHGLLAAVRAHSSGLGDVWLVRAQEMSDNLERRYGAGGAGGLLDHAGQDLAGRLGDPILSLPDNSVAALALFELDVLVGDPDGPHRRRAIGALEAVAGQVRSHGLSAAGFARAVDRVLSTAVKVTTSAPELITAALAANPRVVIQPGDERAIVCIGTICLAPTSDPAAVAAAVGPT